MYNICDVYAYKETDPRILLNVKTRKKSILFKINKNKEYYY